MKLAESLDDVQAFFVTSDYEIHYTKDFQKKIKVTETEQKSIIHEANKVRRTNVQIALALSNISLYNKDMNSITDSTYTTQEKLQILADAAKYDVACTSSGSSRRGKKGELGNAEACGICHSFAADGRCISLLKILMTNHCAYDCKYCINRSSNDVPRATFTPEEICQLTIEFYKRNYIEGLFLSSGVLKNPTYTMEKMCETLLLLRTKYHFNGYIHVKTIPGASDELLAAAGYKASLAVQPGSVNIAIFAFSIYIPLALFVIMFIFLMKNDLEKRYPEIMAELQKREKAN